MKKKARKILSGLLAALLLVSAVPVWAVSDSGQEVWQKEESENSESLVEPGQAPEKVQDGNADERINIEGSEEILGEKFIQFDVPIPASVNDISRASIAEPQSRESINITLHTWWSSNSVPGGLGRNCPDYGILGQRYWLNYEIYETGHWNFENLTGTLLDAEHDFNYNVEETIYYPNGNKQVNCTYNNDNNWVSLIPKENIYTGVYKGIVTVSGDVNISQTVWLDMRSLVTYNVDVGDNVPLDQIKRYGNALVLSNTVPTRNGYTFTGWTASTGDSYYPGTNFNIDNSNVTMRANWSAAENLFLNSAKTVNINFKDKVIWYSFVPNKTADYTFSFSKANNLTPVLYAYNNSFREIDTNGNKNGTFKLTAGEKYYFKVCLHGLEYPTGSFQIILSQDVERHTVTYDYSTNDGVSASKKAETIPKGTQIDLTPTAVKPGWDFVGWNTEKNATGKLDSLVMGNKDITLYAIFKQTNISIISYEANGGNVAPVKQSKTHGEDLILSTERPSRDNYYFLGWAENSTSTVADYLPGDIFTKNNDTTLYAVWETTAEHYDTVLTLDISGSMSSDIQLLKNAASLFCNLILTDNPRNRISIVTFNSTIRKINFSSDITELNEYINSMSASGGTNMAPAVTEARKILQMGAAQNIAKNIIFMADGAPDNSTQVKSEYGLLGNTINTFSLGFHVSGSTKSLMQALQNTGYWDVSDGTDLAGIFEKINNDIRSDVLNRDVISDDGTSVVLEESIYKCDVGETIYVGGTFSSSTISCTSNTVFWETNDPSAVVFGSMSVVGSQDNTIFSIPVTGNKPGVYTVSITTANGASSRRRLEIGTVNKNLELKTRQKTVKYTEKGFETQQFDLDISIHNVAGMLITSNFTESQLEKFTSGNLDVLVTLPEGFSFDKDKTSYEKHFSSDSIEPNKSFDINETVYLRNLQKQESTKQIEISVTEYKDKNPTGVILTGKCNIKISQTPNKEIETLPPKSNEFPQELTKNITYDGDLKIGAGIHLVISKSLTIKGRIIVDKDGCLEIKNTGKLYADALEVKKGGTVNSQSKSVNIGDIIVKGGSLKVDSGLLTSDYLNLKSGNLELGIATITANNLTIEGNGQFMQLGGIVKVSGDFKTATSEHNYFNAGQLWIGGDFTQTSKNNAFQGYEGHSTIFFGNEQHIIKMQKFLGFGNTSSYFDNLYIEGTYLLTGPDKIESIAKNEIYQIQVTDISQYKFKKVKKIATQDEFEKGFVKALDMEVTTGLFLDFNGKIDNETEKAIDECIAAWLTVITSPFMEIIDLNESSKDTHILELTVKKNKKVYFTTEVQNYGSYATYSQIYMKSPDLGISSNKLVGGTTQTSFTAFKTQVVRYLAKTYVEDIFDKIICIGAKKFATLTVGEQYEYAVEKIMDFYFEVKDSTDLISDAKATIDNNSISRSKYFPVTSGTPNIKENLNTALSEQKMQGMSMPQEADIVSDYHLEQQSTLNINSINFRDHNLENCIRAALHLDDNTPVTSEMAQSVKRLDLRNELITEIDGLQSFENLEVLYLSDNYITDLSPLSGLQKLKTLDLGNNNISRLLDISSLKKLQYLNISDNLVNELPIIFSDFSELLYLDISGNNISSLSVVKNIKKIQYLNISDNKISSGDLNDLRNLSGLLELYATNCSLTNVTGINSTSIQVLDISNNKISRLQETSYPKLQVLNANENDISDLSSLQNSNQLRKLYLNYNPLVEIASIKNITSIKELHMSCCNLKDSDMDIIKRFSNLETLNVSFNELTNLLFVLPLTKLKVLDIYGNDITIDNDILNTLNHFGTNVHMSDSTVAVHSVEFLSKNINIQRGENIKLRYFIYPFSATNKTVKWKSNNQTVAEVNTNGIVTAKSKGIATITVTTEDGDYNASCVIAVDGAKIPTDEIAKKVQLLKFQNNDSMSLAVGSSKNLKVIGAKTKLTYKSSNTQIATINSKGKIFAKKVGTIKITITATESNTYQKAVKTITIKVIPKITQIKFLKSKKKGQVTIKSTTTTKNNTGYQIQYKVGKGEIKSIKKKSNKTLLYTIKDLKSKQKFQARIRVYKKVDGKIYYGKYSKWKTLKKIK